MHYHVEPRGCTTKISNHLIIDKFVGFEMKFFDFWRYVGCRGYLEASPYLN